MRYLGLFLREVIIEVMRVQRAWDHSSGLLSVRYHFQLKLAVDRRHRVLSDVLLNRVVYLACPILAFSLTICKPASPLRDFKTSELRPQWLSYPTETACFLDSWWVSGASSGKYNVSYGVYSALLLPQNMIWQHQITFQPAIPHRSGRVLSILRRQVLSSDS